jgi:hypothetical protein
MATQISESQQPTFLSVAAHARYVRISHQNKLQTRNSLLLRILDAPAGKEDTILLN